MMFRGDAKIDPAPIERDPAHLLDGMTTARTFLQQLLGRGHGLALSHG